MANGEKASAQPISSFMLFKVDELNFDMKTDFFFFFSVAPKQNEPMRR